jgi:hypothetical protein
MTMTLTMARAHDEAMSDDPPTSPGRPSRRHFSGYSPGHIVLKAEDGLAVAVKDWICSMVAAAGSMKPGSLTIHADNGGPLICEPVTTLLADLHIGRTHNRPTSPTTIRIPRPSSRC